jgi:hypothetical protein
MESGFGDREDVLPLNLVYKENYKCSFNEICKDNDEIVSL